MGQGQADQVDFTMFYVLNRQFYHDDTTATMGKRKMTGSQGGDLPSSLALKVSVVAVVVVVSLW